ncbi:MAG: hypothetical protein N2254_07150 [bacterium]|nr:hypothetical protein [bacterium]
MSILKLALLILAIDVQNRFSIINLGVGYVGISENPAFTISELTIGEFQDYKLIPSTRYVSFGFFIGGVKLFPSLLLDREDRTFEFVRRLRIIPGGGLAPVSIFFYSQRVIFTIYSGDSSFNIIPNIRIQLIPISDLLLLTIFSPSLFTKKIYTPGPYPHFEVSPSVRGISESFDFELKFGVRTYSLIRPSLSQAEQIAVQNYTTTGAKKIVGREYNQKYGVMFFVNFTLGFGLPSYYVTKVVTREEREVQTIAVESPELKERLSELEKKLAELEKQRLEEEERRKREEEEEKKKRETAAVVQEVKPAEQKVEQKVEALPADELWKAQILFIDKYEKGGKLYLSWKIPPTENLESVSLERCLGYGCRNFTTVTTFSSGVTTYVDQIVENQIYCYRLSGSIIRVEIKGGDKEKFRDRVNSSSVCGYVSYKGELVRVYF